MSFQLKSAPSNQPKTSQPSTKEQVSQVVAAVQQLITSGDLNVQLSSNTNTTLAKGITVDVTELPQTTCAQVSLPEVLANMALLFDIGCVQPPSTDVPQHIGLECTAFATTASTCSRASFTSD